MSVERERRSVPAPGVQRGAAHGPVNEVLRGAEALWRGAIFGSTETTTGVAFNEAEAQWFAALAALLGAPSDVGRAAEDILWNAERSAARAFVWMPAPSLADLPRKLAVIEREADEAANASRSAETLKEWLAIFRADMLRLLAQRAD